jgi:GNAT superfamily N-acetyltransferase
MTILRDAVPADVPVILGFIRELAEFERAPDSVLNTESMLHEALFGTPRRVEALIAEQEGTPVGFALWYENYSTWTGPGLYMDDIFVRPAAQRFAISRLIFAHVAALAVQRGFARFEWAAMEWNDPAQRFYTSLGAEPVLYWKKYRLSGAALAEVAAATA